MPRIEQDVKLEFKDVLIRPKRSTLKSRSEVDLHRTYVFRHSKREWTGVPIIASNMDTTGTFETARVLAAHSCITACHKFYGVEEWVAFAEAHPSAIPFVAASSGSSAAELDALAAIVDAVPSLAFICLDVANGYSEHFVDCVRSARARFPTLTIIAGNVVTGEMVEELVLSGADIVKVGIGPGSVCTTRKQTGVGYPQLSAIIECADSAHGLNGQIVGDGGITCPGDVAKALGAGACSSAGWRWSTLPPLPAEGGRGGDDCLASTACVPTPLRPCAPPLLQAPTLSCAGASLPATPRAVGSSSSATAPSSKRSTA